MPGWFAHHGTPAGSRAVGRRGERAAERMLRRAGYRLLGRNVRVPVGEADLVFESPDSGVIVIVEVKARVVSKADAPRTPERAITGRKGRKLVSVARSIVRARGWSDRHVRIDVVAVDFERGRRRPISLRHYRGAIDAGGART